jgi:hypothetical protein
MCEHRILRRQRPIGKTGNRQLNPFGITCKTIFSATGLKKDQMNKQKSITFFEVTGSLIRSVQMMEQPRLTDCHAASDRS